MICVTVIPIQSLEIKTITSQFPVHIYEHDEGQFYRIWIIDVAPSLISIDFVNNTMSNIESGILLYDKFIQLDGNNLDTLKQNALVWNNNIIDGYSYNSLIQGRYVIVIASSSPSIIDSVSFSYGSLVSKESTDIFTGAIIALGGASAGVIVTIFRDAIRDVAKKKHLESVLRADLKQIREILNSAKSVQKNEWYIVSHNKLGTISLSMYEQQQVEIERLLLPALTEKIRSVYHKIQSIAHPINPSLTGEYRSVKKSLFDETIKEIDELIGKLRPRWSLSKPRS